ncbi:hypothetical protein VIBNISOn1_190006 [Vibrio nigripulchritudo SOn1]|uniref:Uncharacterized protein n=1 Tax=Vibrio nigripulchritudo SOn1 TaxID=1238450 RepID=A0AAV2VQ63_9VIBR|nr:hypothetical protein [Vibrio nigripulchritudo]CCO46787.1 hypothetical protein VIBNISOn1_190006 [Vibrio nigripulchritudo SOn1]
MADPNSTLTEEEITFLEQLDSFVLSDCYLGELEGEYEAEGQCDGKC